MFTVRYVLFEERSLDKQTVSDEKKYVNVGKHLKNISLDSSVEYKLKFTARSPNIEIFLKW